MILVRQVNEATKKKSKYLQEVDSISGPRFAKKISGMEPASGKYRVLVSADMESAYTNIRLIDIFKVLTILCDYVNVKESARSLMLKMVHMILSNNYVETVEDVYKLSECLPMGNSISGKTNNDLNEK